MMFPHAFQRRRISLRSPSGRARGGVALVLVLAFLVLLSVLVLAFFSRAINDRQISNGSANQTKVEMFANGALDTVVGDIKQEMAAGAASPAPSPLPAGVTLYIPKAATAVPCRIGTADTLPNLVKTSASNAAFYAGGNYDTTNYPAPNRACTISSATVSQNGRAISTKRWNYHYLLPKNTFTSDTDATPIAAFTSPNWVMVARDGTNPGAPGSAAGFGTGGVNDPAAANKNYVIGRYAYAIYNEGGLLDMNVAGYPSGTTTAQTAYKRAVALADLTQLPVVKTPISYPDDYLTQSQVDQIVGWRNYASAMPSGIFPALTFGPGPATNYYNFILGNWSTMGFLTTANTSLNSGQSDRRFPDRQSLMRLLIQGVGGTASDSDSQNTRARLQNALQYMGTFSRDLDQPSFSPNPATPGVQDSAGTNGTTYGYGNDAHGLDRYVSTTVKSPYDINPPFPAVRVIKPFTRTDGTAASAGDPLMKHRFPLSRLAEIMRTDTTTTTMDNSNPVYRDFGIYRPTGTGPWLYNHGDGGTILRLSYPTGGTSTPGVAQQGREPDFFELLKAAIDVGSVGRGLGFIYNSTRGYVTDEMALDTLSSQQILQIGANIIDQYDTDGYPTQIVFANFAGVPSKVVSGIEDLPYIESIRYRPVFPSVANGRLLMQPILWNPHDIAGGGTPKNSPTTFQISAKAVDSSQPTTFTITYLPEKVNGTSYTATSQSVTCEWDKPTSAFAPLQFNSGEGNGFYGFRLPTLLGEKVNGVAVPSNASAFGNDGVQVVEPSLTLSGIVAADYPGLLKYPSDQNSSIYCYANKINISGPSPGVEFDLSYLDGITPVVYCSFIQWNVGSAMTMYNTNVNSDATALANLNATKVDTGSQKVMDAQAWAGQTRTDPRTRRWNQDTSQYIYVYAPINVTNNTCDTFRAASGVGYGTHDDNWVDNGLTNAYSGYANSGTDAYYRGFQWAYWAENSIRSTLQTTPPLTRYIRDPDGITRRAMAGYTTDPNQGGTTVSTQANSVYGLPLATRDASGNLQQTTDSRPLILNRPFRSVAELGYAFRGTPWANLGFSFPESGDSALLDVFCVDEPSPSTNGIVEGRVDLNTRQAPVLQALFAGANVETTSTGTDPASVIDSATAAQLAAALVARTNNTNPTVLATRTSTNNNTNPNVSAVPIASRAELVGTWNPIPNATLSSDANPDDFYSGFSYDIGTSPIKEWYGQKAAVITRKREAAIRALVDAGTARTWNLLIDVVAQTGRYAPNAASLDKFSVDGEKRYWLHVAIDRVTGAVVDEKLETVNE